MAIKVRVESLEGAVLYEGSDCKMLKADRGAQLCVKLSDEAVMSLISPRRDCMVTGVGKRKFMAGFNRVLNDGTCVLDLHTAEDSNPPSH